MPWVETESPHLLARHELADEDDVLAVLDQLEGTWERLAGAVGEDALPEPPLDVVVHGSDASLMAARPELVLVRRLAAPAARRYLAGWPAGSAVHVLAPRLLAARASNVEGSAQALALAPSALLAQLVVGRANPAVRSRRHAWVLLGAAQWLSGQSPSLRPAIARRLREGPRPAFPPGARDALLLGGTVFDLAAREDGPDAALGLALDHEPGDPALRRAFDGRPVHRTEDAWRSALERLRPG